MIGVPVYWNSCSSPWNASTSAVCSAVSTTAASAPYARQVSLLIAKDSPAARW